MNWIARHPVRVLAAANIALWLYTLALPVYVRFFEYSPGDTGDLNMVRDFGFQYLLFGWLAPLDMQSLSFGGAPPNEYIPPWTGLTDAPVAMFAWYANPAWAWNIGRMARGLQPRLAPAVAAAVLGLTALHPFWSHFSDSHGQTTYTTPLLGAYLWVLTMTPPLFVAIWSRLDRRDRADANGQVASPEAEPPVP